MSRRGWLLFLGLSALVLTVLWSSSLITGAPSAQVSTPQPSETPAQGIESLFSQLATATLGASDLTATAIMQATQYAPNTEIAATLQAQHPVKNGVFDAYFLQVAEGDDARMTTIRQTLTTRFGWTINEVPVEQIAGANSPLHPNDPAVNGQVVVIPGGSDALTDDELQALENYVAKGGSLIVFASDLVFGPTSLETSPNFDDWMYSSFGMRFNKDLVLDETQAYQAVTIPVATDLNSSHFITTNGISAGQNGLVFEEPGSITIASKLPADVTVTVLARSTAAAYSRTDPYSHLTANTLDKEAGDGSGPFVLAAAAENTRTNARVVVFASTSLGADTYGQFNNIANLSVAFNSLVWATDYNDYYTQYVAPQQNVLATEVEQTLTAPISPTPTIQPGISTFS